jgi:heat shock protein HslJ
MGCPDDLAAQDAWLTALLTSDPAMVLDGDTLRLGDAENGLTLTASS